jgi:hypothetical protein
MSGQVKGHSPDICRQAFQLRQPAFPGDHRAMQQDQGKTFLAALSLKTTPGRKFIFSHQEHQ